MRDRLAQLQTLIAIVDTTSLAKAARRLGKSPPAVTRDLADLELRVGTILIERSTRICSATAAGRRLADLGRQLLYDYDEAVGIVADEAGSPSGHLRITAPITFGSDRVAPLIVPFLEAYPAITIDLKLVDRVVDLIEEEFDVAVRIGRQPDGPLIMRSVGTLRRMFAASPEYLAKRGTPSSPHDLIGHEVIQHDDRGSGAPWHFRTRAGAAMSLRFAAGFTVNHPGVALAAARDGRGIVSVLQSQIVDDFQDGRLLPVLEEFEAEPLPVSILYPSSRRGWRRVRLFVEHLAAGLAPLSRS